MVKRLYFPLKRNTEGDAARVNDDPLGHFSCLSNTAKFLDIEKLAVSVLITTEVKAKKPRTLNRAFGTVKQSAKNTDGKFAGYKRPGSLHKGTRRVTLTTGKEIVAATPDSNAVKTYHTISFRFPAFATILVISDALGTLIPANKIKAIPTATDINPYYKVVGGRSYPIMQKAAAESNTDAQLALTVAQLKALTRQGIEVYPGFALP